MTLTVQIIKQLSDSRVIIKCARCDGTGSIGAVEPAPVCPTCRGKGKLTIEVSDPLAQCSRCRGSGKLGNQPGDPVCALCFGAGCTSGGRQPVIVD